MSEPGILVVGGGIAGAAAAYFLGRRGAKGVVLLERERVLGSHSTGRNAAILRSAARDPSVEAIARAGAAFLRCPPRGFAEGPLIDPCGLLVAAAEEGSPLAPWERRWSEREDVQALTPASARALAPHLRADGLRIWRLASEGRIDVDALVQGFARGAARLGATVETGAAVRELIVEGGAVAGARLEDGRELRAGRTLLAAGGWAGRLALGTGSDVLLRPTRRHLFVTQADARVDPRWPVVWVEPEPFYARPESGGLLLCGCDEVDVDPDRLEVVPAAREAALAKAARFLPTFADARVAHEWAGVRTLTDDGRFVVGPDPRVPGLYWAAGLGGHGITCAAPVGSLAADLLLDGSSRDPAASACDPGRFARAGAGTR